MQNLSESWPSEYGDELKILYGDLAFEIYVKYVWSENWAICSLLYFTFIE